MTHRPASRPFPAAAAASILAILPVSALAATPAAPPSTPVAPVSPAPVSGTNLGAAIAVLQGILSQDTTPIPEGAERATVGKARLGSPLEEVRKVYPGMKPVDRENLGATPIFNPRIQRFVVRGEKLEGLPKPVDLELRFWEGKLWVVVVYIRDNDRDAVREYLVKEFGEPVGRMSLSWKGDGYIASFPGGLNWYSVADRAVAKEVQEWFRAELRKAFEQRRAAQGKEKAVPTSPAKEPGQP